MAYKFKLVHGSTERQLSEHEAKYRVEKQGVPLTTSAIGDSCEHCAMGELHVHGENPDAPVEKKPRSQPKSEGKGAQSQGTAPPAASSPPPSSATPKSSGGSPK